MFKRVIPLGILFSAIAGLIIIAGCSDGAEKPLTPVYKTGIAQGERDSSAFKEQFPEQYASYQRNNESDLATKTRFKASFPFHKNDTTSPPPVGMPGAGQPYLKNLWLGYPFSFEYNDARGHTYAIQDILEIDRINTYGEKAGLPATCWNCKTTKVVDWVVEKGDAFWAEDFNSYRPADTINAMENSISCDTCHDPVDMSLRISSIPFREAMQVQGIDLSKATRNEMRAYVCGQCHVEYYFTDKDHGPDKKPKFPWDNSITDPETIYQYYNDKGSKRADGTFGQFADWVHPVSNTPMLKAQHPDFETWKDGPHGAAGVTCSDCHMPYIRVDGKKKISKHQWASPLRSNETITNACGQCHADKTPEYLRSRVEYTQERIYATLIEAQALSVKAHEAVRQAVQWEGERDPRYDELLVNARENVRKGQFFWDFVSAENGVGFHNPTKTLRTLDLSKVASQKAIDFASAATKYAIAPILEEDIYTLVPPLLDWSRKMQMDPENLKKHVWTQYLPLLPAHEKVWDGQKRLDVKVDSPPLVGNGTSSAQ